MIVAPRSVVVLALAAVECVATYATTNALVSLAVVLVMAEGGVVRSMLTGAIMLTGAAWILGTGLIAWLIARVLLGRS